MAGMHDRFEEENWQRENFKRLGLSLYDATVLVEEGADYHALEAFMALHPTCDIQTAKEIVR